MKEKRVVENFKKGLKKGFLGVPSSWWLSLGGPQPMCIIAIFFDATTTTRRFLSWENYFKGKLNYLSSEELGLVDDFEVRPWLEVNFQVYHSAEIEEFFFELYFYMNYDWKTSETLNLTILEAMEFDFSWLWHILCFVFHKNWKFRACGSFDILMFDFSNLYQFFRERI